VGADRRSRVEPYQVQARVPSRFAFVPFVPRTNSRLGCAHSRLSASYYLGGAISSSPIDLHVFRNFIENVKRIGLGAPKGAPRDPKRPQEGPMKASCTLEIRHKRHICFQEGHKRHPRDPKTSLRNPQEATRCPQDAPKRSPRRPQEAPKRPRCPQEAPKKPPRGPRKASCTLHIRYKRHIYSIFPKRA